MSLALEECLVTSKEFMLLGYIGADYSQTSFSLFGVHCQLTLHVVQDYQQFVGMIFHQYKGGKHPLLKDLIHRQDNLGYI